MVLGRTQRKEVDFPADLDGLLRILCQDEHPFFLDSAVCMPRLARYSIMGSNPFLVMTASGHALCQRHGRETIHTQDNPFHTLRRLLNTYRLPNRCAPSSTPDDEDLPFLGGAVGYLSYDLRHFIERLPCTTLNDIGLPELYLAFHDTALVLDHQSNRAWIVAAEFDLPGRGPAEARMEQLAARLAAAPPDPPAAEAQPVEITCNFTRDEYLRAIQRAKDYIAAGDIFQANISRRFETTLRLPPHELYLRLRAVNPAPMAAFLRLDQGTVISSSPERFLKVRNGHVETRPIKGTRPRGHTPHTDSALARRLLASEKDNAELAMIVDLERNDLGRVCSYGTVRVTQPRVLESFPTVHHLVATVEGDLHRGRDLVDLLKATFPGGSITGAPKIRAMEIIDELEPTHRSVYTGAIGYIGFDGSMDLNIVIRTILERNGRLFFQVGGGIVADSELEDEYDETTHKARALLKAVAGT